MNSTSIWTIRFWKDAAERAVKTAAQAVLLAIGGGAVNALTLDWATLGGSFLGGALLSLLTSIASNALGDKGTASAITLDSPTQ